MNNNRTPTFWTNQPWTLAITAALIVLNLGLLSSAPSALSTLVSWLEYDRAAILAGQVWRVMTGNLVHWSVEHFLLDVGAFLLVGCLYEKTVGRSYPWVLLFSGLAVGASSLIFLPEMATYRGLSGVDSGQFAAVLCLELGLALHCHRNWSYLIPAAAIFITKLVYESMTGQMFFGTESLGNIGQPVPLAHVVGAISAVLFLLASQCRADTLITTTLGDGVSNATVGDNQTGERRAVAR